MVTKDFDTMAPWERCVYLEGLCVRIEDDLRKWTQDTIDFNMMLRLRDRLVQHYFTIDRLIHQWVFNVPDTGYLGYKEAKKQKKLDLYKNGVKLEEGR
jgi:hypothetical protein